MSVQMSYRGAALTVSVGVMGVEDEGIMDDFAICKRQIHHRKGTELARESPSRGRSGNFVQIG